MSKRALVIFGTFAAIFAVVIPFWAISSKGDEGAAAKPVASSDRDAQRLFSTNCGACHTMLAGGTDGVVGPNLDVLLASNTAEAQPAVDGACSRVLAAITGGIGGRMPRGILEGDNAIEVANFVARNVNYLGEQAAAPPTGGGTTGPTGPVTAESTKCATSTSSSSSGSGG